MEQSKEDIFTLLCGNGGRTECTRSSILSVIAVVNIILPAWVCYIDVLVRDLLLSVEFFSKFL